MKMHSRIASLILIAIALVAAGCTGADELPFGDVAAERFLGSAPLDISGPDADDPAITGIASDMVSERRFDLTPSGFTISSGNVNSTAAAGSDFGVGGGTLDVSGDQAAVDLDVFSTNPDVSNANMVGTFSLSEASQALVTPGESFLVDWEINFDYIGFPVQLNVAQELTGTDFQSIEE
jgi:hypothetical protein